MMNNSEIDQKQVALGPLALGVIVAILAAILPGPLRFMFTLLSAFAFVWFGLRFVWVEVEREP